MEKFLFVLKLSKAGIYIGWFKLVVNSLIALILLGSLFWSKLVLKTLQDGLKSRFNDSAFAFYGIMLLLVVYFTLNAAYSLMLIIGSINHQHLKVLSFLIVDAVFTVLTIVLMFCSFPNVWTILIVLVQIYLFYAAFSFWKQLKKEHNTRLEHEADRKRRGEMLLSFA